MDGMLSGMPEQQQAPVGQGMLSGAQQPAQKGYEGVVTVDGKPVEVRNGVAEVDGAKFYVTADGALVIDEKSLPIGYVENGEFHVTDAHHRQILKQFGYLQ